MAVLIVLLVILIGFAVRSGRMGIVESVPAILLGAAFGATQTGGRAIGGIAGFLASLVGMVQGMLG
jgi:hypothetical protein